MKLMKVFDCQDMPDQVREAFFDLFMDNNHGNDCYVDCWVGDHVNSINAVVVYDWLIVNHANLGEHVIIKHWW